MDFGGFCAGDVSDLYIGLHKEIAEGIRGSHGGYSGILCCSQ